MREGETLAAVPAAASALRVNWQTAHMYNTIMAVAAGVALILLVDLMRAIGRGRRVSYEGFALAFGALGFILILTGGAMTLTWPLSAIGTPYDNIIFGEPCLAFGVLLGAASVFLWARARRLAEEAGSRERAADAFAEAVRPLSLFAAGMGLGLVGIAIAGLVYVLFAAPPQEPLSGQFAHHPMVEATFISGLYALTGVGAVLFPVALEPRHRGLFSAISVLWTVAGVLFAVFGALNYFTHIGLIIHTM